MIIQSPAVYPLPSSTTNRTLHSPKQFSIQLSLLIYIQQSHLFPEKHRILNSLQQLHKYMHKGAYESGFASVDGFQHTSLLFRPEMPQNHLFVHPTTWRLSLNSLNQQKSVRKKEGTTSIVLIFSTNRQSSHHLTARKAVSAHLFFFLTQGEACN